MPFGSFDPFVEPLWYARAGIPYYNASHERLRTTVRAYIDEHISPFCAEWEEQGFVPREVCSLRRQPHVLHYTDY
jgi:hypothetical protein